MRLSRAILAPAIATVAIFSGASVFAQGARAEPRLVLKGHDPVAYFTVSKPVKGDPRMAYDWDEGRYYFSNAKNRDTFAANPDRYAPQFGGYCTGSMSRGARNEGDPEAWVIRDGRLYVFGQVKFKEMAEKDAGYLPSKVPGAAKNWQEKKNRAS